MSNNVKIKSIYNNDNGSIMVHISIPEESRFELLRVEDAIPFLNSLLSSQSLLSNCIENILKIISLNCYIDTPPLQNRNEGTK